MSHEHGPDCHCHDCEEEHHNHEKTSMEEAGGVAVGLIGHIHGFNADVEARLDKVMILTGKWVVEQSGCLLGHIKIAIYHDDGSGITLNLTDMDTGVEHHGSAEPCEKINFNFMSAVLDVDSHELEHVMMDALEDSGIDCHLENSHHHHHDHDHEHGEHHHDHDDHDHDDGHCHCKACEERRKEAEAEPEKKHFMDRLRRKKK